jgi:hypothetical protein
MERCCGVRASLLTLQRPRRCVGHLTLHRRKRMERIIDRHGLGGCATRIPVSVHMQQSAWCMPSRSCCMRRSCMHPWLSMHARLFVHAWLLSVLDVGHDYQLIIHALERRATLYHCEFTCARMPASLQRATHPLTHSPTHPCAPRIHHPHARPSLLTTRASKG